MEVKPIHLAPNFKITSSDEARDEERQKKDPRGGAKGKDRQAFGKTEAGPAESSDEGRDSSSEAANLSQLVDSNTVVELLAHRPPNLKRPPRAFQVAKKDAALGKAERKKIDRSF
jgi:hypothetical protein